MFGVVLGVVVQWMHQRWTKPHSYIPLSYFFTVLQSLCAVRDKNNKNGIHEKTVCTMVLATLQSRFVFIGFSTIGNNLRVQEIRGDSLSRR